MTVTFHRAVDVCKDTIQAVEVCQQLGIDRILTSGAQSSAASAAALDTLRAMVEKAKSSGANESGYTLEYAQAFRVFPGGTPVVMAGGGVTADNVAEVVSRTGVQEVKEGNAGVTGAVCCSVFQNTSFFLVARTHNNTLDHAS